MKEERQPQHDDSQREQFEQDRITRRAALRKAGVTSLLSVFTLVAADDVARLVLAKMKENAMTRGLADSVARDFRSAGVAFATTTDYCIGVLQSPCPDSGSCPGGVGPCISCADISYVNCENCQEVATWKKCNCRQAAANAYPDCVECNGEPKGDPTCLGYNLMIANCNAQFNQDWQNCPPE